MRRRAAGSGDRPAARGAVIPEPGVGGAGPGLAGLAWAVMTPAAARLLQELRRQLHYPSRLEQEVVDQPLMPPPKMPSWEPASTAFTISGTPPSPVAGC
jgi:hypothetical protein